MSTTTARTSSGLGRRTGVSPDAHRSIVIGVGAVGLALPIVVILGEIWLDGAAFVRGSISAYYHSGMRDFFVGSLCVVGFLLITFRHSRDKAAQFWISLVAGVAVLGVGLLPTARKGLGEVDYDFPFSVQFADGKADCAPLPSPTPACSAIQSEFGEANVAIWHFVCAIVFIASLAALCVAFARESETKALHYLCAGAIAIAFVWIGVGIRYDDPVRFGVGLTHLYFGEALSVVAFSVSWLVKGLVNDRRRA